MRKKKQDVVTDSSAPVDLASAIHQDSLFFDKLVELIPAKFYLPNDDSDKPWFQGLSKAEKLSAKKETKENIKKSRRDRLDPDKSSATTIDLLKQCLEKQKLDKNDGDEEEMKPLVSGLEGDDKSVTYEELKERLHSKLEEFRASRNSVNPEKAKKRMERNDKKGTHEKKRKRDAVTEENKPTSSELAGKVEKDAEEASKGLMFSQVKLGEEEKHGKKKRKMSKMKKLEKAKKLAEAKKDPEKGESLAWKAALDRASGKKVHDDPKLLAKSLKKEKKRRQKSALKWKERIQSTEKLRAEKQERRSENIAERIREKKARRIAKREKKLLRPGFEGRKEGFLNDNTA